MGDGMNGISKRGLKAAEDRNLTTSATEDETEVDAVYINLAENKVVSERFGDITEHVVKALQRRLFEATLRAPLEQEQLHALSRARGERKALGDMGVTTMEVTPAVYWHWRLREGPEAWGDKGFRKDLLRDNPVLAAPAPVSNTVGYGSKGRVRRGKPVHTGRVIVQGMRAGI